MASARTSSGEASRHRKARKAWGGASHCTVAACACAGVTVAKCSAARLSTVTFTPAEVDADATEGVTVGARRLPESCSSTPPRILMWAGPRDASNQALQVLVCIFIHV